MNRLAKILVGLLGLQFILGMLANLYSNIPKNHPYEVFGHFGYILIHSLNAILLLVLAIAFLWLAIKEKIHLTAAIWGLIGIIVAFISGHLFVSTQQNIYSLIMSLGFILAFGSYGLAAAGRVSKTGSE